MDGLQKRSGKKGGVRTTASTVMTRRKTTKNIKVTKSSVAQIRKTPKKVTSSRISTTRTSAVRKIGIPEDEKELKRIQRANEHVENVLVSSKDNISDTITEIAATEPEQEDDDREAVRDFLDNVKDEDPTDLVEIPERENSKAWRKKMKQQQKKGKKKIGRWIALVIVLLLGAGFAFAYRWLDKFVGGITDNGNLLNLILADPYEPLQTDENGRTNILIFGTEGYDMDDPNYDGGYLTDSMMVMSINQEDGDIKAISLPRDLKDDGYADLVSTFHPCTGTAKINEVYWCTYMRSDGSDAQNREYEVKGAQALEETFEEVLGLDIQYYVHANWATVEQAIDAIDGIDVVFTYDDQTWDGPETQIKVTDERGIADCDAYSGLCAYEYGTGEVVHLDGGHALMVARTRNAFGGYGASNGNFSREYFQQKIIEASMKKIKEKGLDLTAVLGIKAAIGDNVRTNFKDTEIKSVLTLSQKLDINSISTISLFDSENDPLSEPLMTTGTINGISYVYPSAGVGNYSNIHSYVKRRLLAGGFADEMAEIVILNGTDEIGLAHKENLELTGLGFVISQNDNAPDDQSDFEGVRIYKNNSNNPKTEAELKKHYGVNEISDQVPESLAEYEEDFIIIIGER